MHVPQLRRCCRRARTACLPTVVPTGSMHRCVPRQAPPLPGATRVPTDCRLQIGNPTTTDGVAPGAGRSGLRSARPAEKIAYARRAENRGAEKGSRYSCVGWAGRVIGRECCRRASQAACLVCLPSGGAALRPAQRRRSLACTCAAPRCTRGCPPGCCCTAGRRHGAARGQHLCVLNVASLLGAVTWVGRLALLQDALGQRLRGRGAGGRERQGRGEAQAVGR